jgi:hypothetical protein
MIRCSYCCRTAGTRHFARHACTTTISIDIVLPWNYRIVHAMARMIKKHEHSHLFPSLPTCKLQLSAHQHTNCRPFQTPSRRNFEQVPAGLPATRAEDMRSFDSKTFCRLSNKYIGRSKAAPPCSTGCCTSELLRYCDPHPTTVQHPLIIIQTANNRCHETIIMPLTTRPNVSEKLLHPPQSSPSEPGPTSCPILNCQPITARPDRLPCIVTAVPVLCELLSPRFGRWEPSLELARTSPCSMRS